METLLYLFGSRQDVGNIGFFRFPEWCGNANDDRIAFRQVVEVYCCAQALVIDEGLDGRRFDVPDVGNAGVYLVCFSGVNFKTDSLIARSGKLSEQRQPDITQSYDSN